MFKKAKEIHKKMMTKQRFGINILGLAFSRGEYYGSRELRHRNVIKR